MRIRDRGRRAARRWTAVIALAGVALTGATGIGVYVTIEGAGTPTHASSGSSSATPSSGLSAGSGSSDTTSSGS